MRRLQGKESSSASATPVYTYGHPRNKVIKEVARRLSRAGGDTKLFDIAERIEQVMLAGKEDVRPILDWYSAGLYHMMAVPTAISPRSFVVSRTSGWFGRTSSEQRNRRVKSSVGRHLYRPRGPRLGAPQGAPVILRRRSKLP